MCITISDMAIFMILTFSVAEMKIKLEINYANNSMKRIGS